MSSQTSLPRLPILTTNVYISPQGRTLYEGNEGQTSSSSSRASSFLTTPHSSSNSHSGHSATSHYDHVRYLTYGPIHSQERAIPRHVPENLGVSRNPTPFEKRQTADQSAGYAVHPTPLTLTGQSKITVIGKGPARNYPPHSQGNQYQYQEPDRGTARNALYSDVSSSIPFPTAHRSDPDGCDESPSYSTPRPSRQPTTSSDRPKDRLRLGPHRFLVSRQVGKGGFGRVYEGIEVQSGHVVAIKTVQRRGLARHRVDAVLKEQLISRKVSENRCKTGEGGGSGGAEFVVRMVSSFLTPSHFVFVLDYHGAGDLRDVDFPLKTADARFYIGEMALGLRYLHSQKIILRDLKPANALLGFDGHVRLADFGLATIANEPIDTHKRTREVDRAAERSRTSSVLSFTSRARAGSLRSMADTLRLPKLSFSGGRKRSNTAGERAVVHEGVVRSKSWNLGRGKNYRRPRQNTVLCGTPGYISPEGYQGRHGPEGDIWALGITLFEFITGVNPFDTWGEPTTEIKTKVQYGEPFYPEGMPKETKSVLEKLLRKKWKKRATLDEMMDHPFFKADGFSWEKLQKREIKPPPLPEAARERLRRASEFQLRDNTQYAEMPLILHLEHESMTSPAIDSFREELTAEETSAFYMDDVDRFSPRSEWSGFDE